MENQKPYDSTNDTMQHIQNVQGKLHLACDTLKIRAERHDLSKLHGVEKTYFDKFTPLLKDCTYGSEEYKEYLKELKVALDHHYANNSHHPEYYEKGIAGMDLFDVIEMFFDWKAATERHTDGDIYKSIEINKTRFNMSEQLVSIFTNTAKRLFY